MSESAKKTPKKKANGGATRKSVAKEGYISLADLSKELKIEPRLARVKLRKAEIENPGRWTFKDGSAELTKVRKLLSAEASA